MSETSIWPFCVPVKGMLATDLKQDLGHLQCFVFSRCECELKFCNDMFVDW